MRQTVRTTERVEACSTPLVPLLDLKPLLDASGRAEGEVPPSVSVGRYIRAVGLN